MTPETSPRTLQAQRPFTVDDFLALRKLTSARISPNGERVIYVEERLDRASDGVRTRLMLIRRGDDVVSLAENAASPAWSPDGSSIAFLRPGPRGPELWIVSPEGGRERPLSFAPGGVVEFAWAPDSRRIAAAVLSLRREPALRLMLLDLPARTSLPLPTYGMSPENPTWSPDGSRIAFSAEQDVHVISLVDRRRRTLVQRDGPDTEPQWSPDGKWIAFASGGGRWGDGVGIGIVPASGGAVREYGDGFDGWFPTDPPRFWRWGPEGDRIVFTGTHRMTHLLYELSLETGQTRELTPGPQAYWSFSLSSDGKTMAFLASDSANPGDVYLSPVTPFAPRRLTAANPQLSGVGFGSREVLRWTAPDGLAIEGLLMKPAGYDRSRRYPLIVLLEGSYGTYDLSFSTRVASDDNWTFPFQPQILAGAGYLVLMPNPRGSWGYGRAFAEMAVSDFADGPHGDVMTGIRELVRRGIADSSRVGVAGLWLDAYRTVYSLTRTDHFAAAVVGEPIFDLIDWYRRSESPIRHLIGGSPEENPALFNHISPIRCVAALETPTSIFHIGSPPWALAQGRALHDSLQARGVPAQIRVYRPRSAMVIQRSVLRQVLRQGLGWFDRWL